MWISGEALERVAKIKPVIPSLPELIDRSRLRSLAQRMAVSGTRSGLSGRAWDRPSSVRGRDIRRRTPPAQIRTSGFPAGKLDCERLRISRRKRIGPSRCPERPGEMGRMIDPSDREIGAGFIASPRDPDLHALYQYWDRVRRDRVIPSRQDIDPPAIPIAPHHPCTISKG
jgi:PAS domain-containing protein